jgi:hypothetical protein
MQGPTPTHTASPPLLQLPLKMGALKVSFWVATVNMHGDVTLPEQTGSKTRASNTYTPKTAAGLKKAILKKFLSMAEDGFAIHKDVEAAVRRKLKVGAVRDDSIVVA